MPSAIQPIIVILGPTASGKSAVAHSLAKRIGAEIISVDSMAIYRGMNLGTAKPTAQEQAEVRYHLIDIIEPDQTFTVARYVELADAVIADAANRGRRLIAVGGTPLYYKALFQGLFDGPPADPELRKQIVDQGNQAMWDKLNRVDPTAAGRIHINDTKRLVRALEIHELTGKPISSIQQQWSGESERHPGLYFGLHWEKEYLNRRINARVRSMIEAGWLEEIRQLLKRYGQLSPTAGEATGYAELIAHLQGHMELDEAVEKVKIATRQLARKQMKWFRRFPNVHWMAGGENTEEIVQRIAGKLADCVNGD